MQLVWEMYGGSRISQECTEEDCEKCQWNASCHYVELPKRYELKTGSGKKGKIIPTDAQQKVIDFRRGVCRVNATAGSGKTECMTERGARMFEETFRGIVYYLHGCRS